MCRKFTLDFGTDAKHKFGFIWHKNSLRPTSWYSEDYQVLSRFGLGNDEKGGEITCKALIYFQKPCCFSMPGIYTHSSSLKSFPEFQRLCHSVCGMYGESLPDVNYFEVSLIFQE
jgi:hypothetical protein